MFTIKSLLTTISLLLLTATRIWSLDETKYQLLLKPRSFIPKEGMSDFTTKVASKNKIKGLHSRMYHAVVQFYDIPDEQRKQRLQKAGVRLHHYLPNFAFTASVDSMFDSKQMQSLGIRTITRLTTTDKIEPALLTLSKNETTYVSAYILVIP
jgi:hypothetical protein